MKDAICFHQCPDRWCCGCDAFSPPPLCSEDLRAIGKMAGDGFFDVHDVVPTLKVKPSGYCTFFDEEKKSCAVYPERPLDCRMFPFDFVTFGPERGVWVMWDCPFARSLDPEMIEAALAYFETHHAAMLFETWHYGNADYADIHNPTGYRRLRPMRISPPKGSRGSNASCAGDAESIPQPENR